MNIILKKWDISDKNSLIRICNNVDRRYISNRVPYPYTDDDALFWFNFVKEREGKDGIYRAVIVDGECIGNISVERKSDVHSKDAEIGYMLQRNMSSKGIMTEAVRQICTIAFNELDIIRITGLVYKPNKASQRVLEKNDFTLEGVMKNAVYKDGNIYDMCIFGKVR